MAATDWPEAKQIKLRDALRKVTLCNCGGGTIYEIILEVLERSKVRWDHYNDPANKGKLWTGPFLSDPAADCSGRWFEFVAHYCAEADLLDYGGSVGGAWTTPEGDIVIEFLREFGVNNGIEGVHAESSWPWWATLDEPVVFTEAHHRASDAPNQ